MSKRFLVACGLTLVASTAAATPPVRAEPARRAPAKAAARPAPAPKLPAMTADRIVERNVSARGGSKAWRAVTSLTLSGQLDAGGKPNVELPFVMKLKRGHKSRLEVSFKTQTAVQVYDGTQGWKVRPFLNRSEVEPYTEAEARSAAAWEELDGPLIDHARKGTRVELVGTEAVEGNATYKLRLTYRDGERRHVWIDGKTFLERKMEGEPRKLDGKAHRVALLYRTFKTERGLTTPRVLETVVDGVAQTRKLTIAKVTVNEPMPDSLFEKPRLAALATPAR